MWLEGEAMKWGLWKHSPQIVFDYHFRCMVNRLLQSDEDLQHYATAGLNLLATNDCHGAGGR